MPFFFGRFKSSMIISGFVLAASGSLFNI
jgi:hypothetical protein